MVTYTCDFNDVKKLNVTEISQLCLVLDETARACASVMCRYWILFCVEKSCLSNYSIVEDELDSKLEQLLFPITNILFIGDVHFSGPDHLNLDHNECETSMWCEKYYI